MSSKKRTSQKRLKKFIIKFSALVILMAAAIVLLCIFAQNEAQQAVQEEETETESVVADVSLEEEVAIAAGLVVVIDPGHGFDDVGNDRGFLSNDEAVYTLLYANEIKEKLEELGVTVFLTHDGETYPDEDELTSKISQYGITFSSWNVQATAGDNLYNKYERVMYTAILDYEYGVDFFLSVHFNANESPDVSGTAIYYYESNPDVEVCEAFAQIVMDELGYSSNYSGIYATTYADSYAVIKYSDFASALIECAFMTNEDDAANIASYTWRDQVTTIIANAIVEALTGQEVD